MKTLKEIRFEKNVTQLEMYIRCGVSQARISLMENGKYIPSEDERKKLAEALGMSENEIRWPELALAGGGDEVQDSAF